MQNAKRIPLTILVAMVATVLASGCGKSPEEQFRDDCNAKGGTIKDHLFFLTCVRQEAAEYPEAVADLADGRFLVAGGEDADGLASAASRIIHEQTGIEQAAAPMHGARAYASAVLLANGRVLVTGGFDEEGLPRDDAEIYDPVLDHWTLLESFMSYGRARHTSTLTSAGDVLIEGPGGTDLFRVAAMVFEAVTL